MTRARPLRFLALALGLWIGARAIVLTGPVAPTPAELIESGTPVNPIPPTPLPTATRSLPLPLVSLASPASAPRYSLATARPLEKATLPGVARVSSTVGPAPTHPRAPMAPGNPPFESLRADPSPAVATTLPGTQGRSRSFSPGSRWSGSAWLLVREGEGRAALAPGGTLGGSQAGGRLLYRVGGGFSLSGRIYAPLRRTAEAEAAAGIDWQPSARMPIHLLAERRQDVGGAGRSAFALTLYGGASRRLPGGLRGEAYAQAGVVGRRSRDLFVDGSVRVSLPVGSVEIGGSVWGAAQPEAARLDAGPSASYRLPVRRANIRVQADWRFRIAGEAAPDSGPALTLATDF